MKAVVAVTLLFPLLGRLAAQTPIPSLPEPAIEDNSFLIEEAYNQEAGVVQHINTLSLSGADRRNLFYTFTQEWPLVSQRHQLSYTVPFTRSEGGAPQGFGDIQLNYRYQLGAYGRRWAFAPRLSVLLPSGSVEKGLGSGSTGVQVNLPLSVRISRDLVAHWNAGATLLPSAQGPDLGGSRMQRTVTSYNLGASLIGPVTWPVQLMLEATAGFNQAFTDAGLLSRSTVTVVSPGVRAAVNLGGLQIVPGIAVPVSWSDGHSETDVFFYLSFEHPFAHGSGGEK